MRVPGSCRTGGIMRALFITSPGLSHILPTVPLAQALRALGHEVRYATGGDIRAVAEAGLCAVDVSPGVNYAKLFVPDDTDVTDPMHSEGLGEGFFAEMFARVSAVAVDGALRTARSWRPDLVVHTPTQGAGPLTAAALQLPCVELPLGPADSEPGLGALIRRAMSKDYERHGVTGEPTGSVRLTTTPPSVEALLPEDRRSPGAWPMRYVPYNGGAVLPDWLPPAAGRRRIAVTLGSIDALSGGIAKLAPLFSEVADVDAEFVLTLGGGDLALLGELPANVRVVEWIPLGALLETCDAIIHHGGSGTLLTALAAGVPQCVIPHGSYQDTNRDVLTGLGIGFDAEAGSLGAEQCRRLLDDAGLREAALRVRQEMSEMPPPAETAAKLVALAG
nr:putative glycosyl transferase [Streptomyces nogalater]WBU77272.1 SnogD [Cosmid vector pSnogaori_NGS]